MTPIARLTLRGSKIHLSLYLPVMEGAKFDPERLSYPWPGVHGTWEGAAYFAEVDFDEESSIFALKWNDGEVTRFELRSGALLKVGLVLRLKSTRTSKVYDLLVSEVFPL